MISFGNRWSPREGNSISIRTPRLLQSTSEPVLRAVQRGDIAALKMLFGQPLASPFDISPLEYDPLLNVTISNSPF